MITPCPHCQTEIEIDAATHAALAGQSHFACPACQGSVPVPIDTTPRLNVPQVSPKVASVSAVQARSGQRNLLVLGTVALLVLGGIGVFLASQKSGDTHNTVQNINNDIINNAYFQNLIATGVTTREDLEAIAMIRPYETGFIGVSKEPLGWDQAVDLAKRSGSEILAVEDNPAGSRKQLLAWLFRTFGSHLSSTIWVCEHDEVRVLDGADILVVTTQENRRRVMLAWGQAQSRAPILKNEQEFSAAQAQAQADFHRSMSAANPLYNGKGRISFREGKIVGLDLGGCNVSDLSPLRGLALQSLELWESKVKDLSPLSGMRLTRLNIGGCTRVDDISPLKGMPLESLLMSRVQASDLAALEGAPLTYLNIFSTPVFDLTPLRNSPLEVLDAGWCESLQDLSPLRGLPLRELHVNGTFVENLEPLKNLKLTELSVSDTRVSDLSPLAKCPLVKLRFTVRSIKRGISEVRAIPTLLKIEEGRGNKIGSAEDFWKSYDSK